MGREKMNEKNCKGQDTNIKSVAGDQLFRVMKNIENSIGNCTNGN